MKSNIKVALVTNIPTPYRNPVFKILAESLDISLKVFFCSEREPDRDWDFEGLAFDAEYLPENFYKVGGVFVHANFSVYSALRRFHPDVVIGTGFNPTHVVAFLYSRIARCEYVPMTDGTLESERRLSFIHRWLRRRIFKRSKVFIAASDGGFDLYARYGISSELCFKSHLCGNNAAFERETVTTKKYDLIFSGRFVDVKNPFFALSVAVNAAKKLNRKLSIAFLGSGPLENTMREQAQQIHEWVEVHFLGFALQADLPKHYGAARIMLFPTLWDPWGIVANESLAAGVPVIISPVAGSANEIVRHQESGFVLPLDISLWVNAVVLLLMDDALRERMGKAGKLIVKDYHYQNAAQGIADAVRSSVGVDLVKESENDRALPKRNRVVIVQRRMTHYRIDLFNLLREQLQANGVDLKVVYGDADKHEIAKHDSASLAWGVHVPTRYLLKGLFCWQNIGEEIKDSDLVIIPQENKMLFNFWLILNRRKFKLAYWGHGKNFQATKDFWLSELIKKFLLPKVDWWFAYTLMTVQVLKASGFENSKITLLNNAMDTKSLGRQLATVTDEEKNRLLTELDLHDAQIGLAIGSLYKDKRIDFLLQAAQEIHAQNLDFRLIILGDGEDSHLVKETIANGAHWIHWVGVKSGREKAVFLSISHIILNPGMVGLSLLDSFVAQVPMITTDCDIHSPEFYYLEDGINGLVSPNNLSVYSSLVLSYLHNPQMQRELKQGCEISAKQYSVEKMASVFSDGIIAALNS